MKRDATKEEIDAVVARIGELGLSEDVSFIPFTQDTAGLYQASDSPWPGSAVAPAASLVPCMASVAASAT